MQVLLSAQTSCRVRRAKRKLVVWRRLWARALNETFGLLSRAQHNGKLLKELITAAEQPAFIAQRAHTCPCEHLPKVCSECSGTNPSIFHTIFSAGPVWNCSTQTVCVWMCSLVSVYHRTLSLVQHRRNSLLKKFAYCCKQTVECVVFIRFTTLPIYDLNFKCNVFICKRNVLKVKCNVSNINMQSFYVQLLWLFLIYQYVKRGTY